MAETRKKRQLGLIIGGGVLMVLAALAWVMLNKLAPSAATAISTKTATPASVAQVQRVSLADAKAAYDAKSAVFLDVRDRSSFEQSHLPGAVNIPISDLATRMNELDPKSWIIPYCT